MLTPRQALDIQCALIQLRLQHRWHFSEDGTLTYIFACACSRCECLDELIVAVLNFIETHTP